MEGRCACVAIFYVHLSSTLCILFVIAGVAFAVVGFRRICAVCVRANERQNVSCQTTMSCFFSFWAKKNHWNEIITISVKWDNWWDLNEFGVYDVQYIRHATTPRLCVRSQRTKTATVATTTTARTYHSGLNGNDNIIFGLSINSVCALESRDFHANHECSGAMRRRWRRQIGDVSANSAANDNAFYLASQ